MRSLAPRTPGKRSVVLREEAVIAASAGRIWNMMTDFESYPTWNPWLRAASGRLEPGGVVWADVMLDKKRMRAKHLVLTVEPGHRLCWRDAGWNAAFVYAHRCRTLTPLPGGSVRFEQEILLDGTLARLAARWFGPALQKGLAAETAALKQRAETP
jgi:hypothetical protein